MSLSGSLAARYDYDPYGQQTIIQQNLQTTFAYAGYFLHAPSGLYLTLSRPLNSLMGRWLSRDPVGEFLGEDLYTYVANNPLSYVDPTGLDSDSPGQFTSISPANPFALYDNGAQSYADFQAWFAVGTLGRFINIEVPLPSANTSHTIMTPTLTGYTIQVGCGGGLGEGVSLI